MQKQARDYCPYRAPNVNSKIVPKQPKSTAGICLMMGENFIIVPRKELTARNIPVRKTEHEICVGEVCKPVYEKANWDCCHELNQLFLVSETYKLADFAVTEITYIEGGKITTISLERWW